MVVAALTAAGLGTASAADEPTPAQAHVAYVASAAPTYVGCFDSPACGVEPDGSFYVTPTGRSFTLSIDDIGTPDGGQVWVSVSGNGVDFAGCLPVRTSTTFTGHGAGAYAVVTLRAVGVPCPATAGVVIVSGAEV